MTFSFRGLNFHTKSPP